MKHGKVKIDEAGAVTFVEGAGLMKYATDAVTTLFSLTEAPVGYASAVQKVGLVLAGNAVAVHSLTGSLGLSAAGRTLAKGR